jgi:hypothetical protein
MVFGGQLAVSMLGVVGGSATSVSGALSASLGRLGVTQSGGTSDSVIGIGDLPLLVGRMAYFWGWPLVYVYNQRTTLTKVPESLLLNGALPLAPMNQAAMPTGYNELTAGTVRKFLAVGPGLLAR